MSAMDRAGLTTTFGNGKGVTWKADGTIVLTGQNVNGMYILKTLDDLPNHPIAMTSLSQPTSIEQWHQQLAHCSPLTIQEMASKALVDSLIILETTLNGKCEDCIMGCQTHQPFDGVTKKDLAPLDLVTFNLWGPSHVLSAGEKTYMMVIVDGGTSYKYGVYLPDKSDETTIPAFDAFCTRAKTATVTTLNNYQITACTCVQYWASYLLSTVVYLVLGSI